MHSAVKDRYKMSHGYAIRRETYPRPNWVSRGDRMDLRCPSCNGTDLKKISVAYQEGLSRVDARTRLRGFVLGSDGPDVIVGKAVTQGVHQTQLSKRLRPPVKWSYLKLTGWSALVSFAALIGYVHSVMSSSTRASALPVAISTVVLAAVFLFLLGLFWRHNQLIYPRQHAEWSLSFICQRCGAVSVQSEAGTT
jgi:hypothetical protein